MQGHRMSLQIVWIEQKDMTFDHSFAIYSPFLLPSFFSREDKRRKEYPKSWSKVMPFCSIIGIMHSFLI